MGFILGIETSCDETGAAVFDTRRARVVSNSLFSQIDLHKMFGGVVPEIASRSQLEKIGPIVQHALDEAAITCADLEAIAVTTSPGLAGSLLVGVSFAKGMAWSWNKPVVQVNHLEGHIFSAFLDAGGVMRKDLEFDHLCLSASGGHTALYLVQQFGQYQLIEETIDDAAGEAFDKIAKVLGLGYPGGRAIEEYATKAGLLDYFKYPRTKNQGKKVFFSFSGLKTAVLYDLVRHGVYDMQHGTLHDRLTPELIGQVSSSLLVCVGDIFVQNVAIALEQNRRIKGLTFVGGVACNRYLRARLQALCDQKGIAFVATPPVFCTDNGAMIALVGAYRAQQGLFSPLDFDIF